MSGQHMCNDFVCTNNEHPQSYSVQQADMTNTVQVLEYTAIQLRIAQASDLRLVKNREIKYQVIGCQLGQQQYQGCVQCW